MSFFKFNLKSTLKNKFNIVPLIIAIAIVSVCLFFNNRNYDYTGLRAMRLSSISTMKEHNEELLKRKETSSGEEKEMINSSIEYNKYRIKEDEKIISNIDSGDWETVYSKMIKSISEDKENYKNSNVNSIELERAIERDLLYYQYLLDNKLPYQDPIFPTKGISFFIWMMKNIFPIMISIFIIFILTQNYSKMFYERLNIYSLLPYSKLKNTTLTILSSFFISIIVMLSSSLITFIPSSLIFGIGTFDYPILFYNGPDEIYFQSMSSVYFKSLILFTMSILFCTLVTYLINYLFRNQLTSLFITLLIIIGPFMLLNIVQPLQKVAHLLPTTYLSSVSITLGEMGYQLSNFQINFNNGILVLLCSILIIILIIITIQGKSRYMEKIFSRYSV